ncbi:MAG: nucleotide exchange factor GrpE [Erysipelotrichales bacterium]|nr:nucleotide exchange factor GrpE [Erysipelotrichales bacterium]
MNEKDVNQTVNEEVEATEEVVETVEVDEIAELTAKVEELTKALADAKNDYYKAYADAENRKKRLQQDYETNMKYRIQSFALDILPVLDNFERALAVKSDDESIKNYLTGFKMIYDGLMNALQKEGVEVIEAKDKPFDPNVHQALMTEKVEGVEADIVLEELQKGYKLKDRVIRPSYVKVSE